MSVEYRCLIHFVFDSDVITSFHFQYPNSTIENGKVSFRTDMDGDLIVPRKNKDNEGIIKIGMYICFC